MSNKNNLHSRLSQNLNKLCHFLKLISLQFVCPSIIIFSSCNKQFFDYGYSTYNLNGRKAKFSELTPNQICIRAKEEGFLRVIEIRENEMDDIITLTHECTSHIDSY